MFKELIATGFGIGRLGYAPGTLGTLLGIPLAYLFGYKTYLLLVFIVLFYPIAYTSVQDMLNRTREKDPEEVVVDEILGYLACFTFVEPSLKSMVLAFVLFRIFDVLKPFPINLFERFPGAHGVIADDLAAGFLVSGLLFFLIQ